MSAANANALIVEGIDDQHVIKHLCRRRGIDAPQIIPKDGFDGLRDSIFGEVNVPGRRALGIVADANADHERRWQSISDQLKRAGCAVPERLDPGGSVFVGPRIVRVGVWIMPGDMRSGELEDFVADMVPASPAWDLAREYIDGIPSAHRKFSPNKKTRAYVHAWLASREGPRPMGLAIAAGDLDAGVRILRTCSSIGSAGSLTPERDVRRRSTARLRVPSDGLLHGLEADAPVRADLAGRNHTRFEETDEERTRGVKEVGCLLGRHFGAL